MKKNYTRWMTKQLYLALIEKQLRLPTSQSSSKCNNWQPTPKGKVFYIGVRLYQAKAEWLNGQYKLPVPVMVQN
jgi:hypothetical protein